jgi:uncharacterized linocin/CFP29 family protein
MTLQALVENGVMNPMFDALDVNTQRPFVEGVGQFQFQGNALLRRYDWEVIDRAVVDIARMQNNVTNDLRAYGLVQPLGGLGTMLTTYERGSDMSAANIDMAGDTDGQNDGIAFSPVSIPVPILHKGFSVNIRMLDASRRGGSPLDTTHVTTATRRVNDALENMIVNGATLKSGGNSIYGLTTHPDRTTDTATNFGGGAFTTEGNAYKTIAGMIEALYASGFNGPYGCYVATNRVKNLWGRHTDGSGMSEVQSILQNLGPAGLQYVRPAASLASSTLVVVQLSPDVVDLGIAQDMVVVQWETKGNLVANFKVMTAAVPRVKSDASGACGVAHATSA